MHPTIKSKKASLVCAAPHSPQKRASRCIFLPHFMHSFNSCFSSSCLDNSFSSSKLTTYLQSQLQIYVAILQNFLISTLRLIIKYFFVSSYYHLPGLYNRGNVDQIENVISVFFSRTLRI